ncbi:MAG: TrmB family transcriptional regulator, partial [Deltaproteobacteria bacterium]|nr:TrmB family transcriptional regulator [Deltaproteobacteria bacterium]
MERKVLSAMTELGFTKSESKVYTALLKKQPATGYELAASSGVPRSA